MKIFWRNENDSFHFDVFYVQFKEQYFPWSDWDDFYVWIVTDWIQTLLINENKNCSDFRLDFMDGPYYMLCTKNDNKLSIIGIDHDKATAILDHIDFFELKSTLLDIGKQILQDAKTKCVWNDDLEMLQNTLNKTENSSLS